MRFWRRRVSFFSHSFKHFTLLCLGEFVLKVVTFEFQKKIAPARGLLLSLLTTVTVLTSLSFSDLHVPTRMRPCEQPTMLFPHRKFIICDDTHAWIIVVFTWYFPAFRVSHECCEKLYKARIAFDVHRGCPPLATKRVLCSLMSLTRRYPINTCTRWRTRLCTVGVDH